MTIATLLRLTILHRNAARATSTLARRYTTMGNQDFIVTFAESATDDQVAQAKKSVTEQGGTIKDEYTLIKGFSASFPDDHVSTLASQPGVENVEKDGEVTTQS